MPDAALVDWVMVVITVLIAFVSLMAWRVSKLVAWLTGAIESHSSLMLRLEARRGVPGEPVKVVWWDPTLGDPPLERKHGEEAELHCIYTCLPPRQRQRRRSWLIRWFAGEPG